jgi:hypothetical protein
MNIKEMAGFYLLVIIMSNNKLIPTLVMYGFFALSVAIPIGTVSKNRAIIDSLWDQAKQKADVNANGCFDFDERITLYRELNFDGEKYLHEISRFERVMFLKTYTSIEDQEYWFALPEYVNYKFNDFADADNDGIISQQEGEHVYRFLHEKGFVEDCTSLDEVYGLFSPFVSSVLLEMRNLFITPWKAGEGSELERYVKGE